VAQVHATAIVDPRAELASSAKVGPYCVIGPGVVLDEDAELRAHVVAEGPTRLGRGVVIHPFASIGAAPQDRTYAGEPTELEVGEGTVIREHATLHRGTRKDRGRTTVGARCLLMVGVHVAHDVQVGDGCTIANACQLAGHVALEDGVVLGGAVALAPFVRVGELAFVAAGACVEQDVPPYHIAQGDRARVRAINVVGLRRAGLDAPAIDALSRAHRVLYRSGHPLAVGIEALAADPDPRVARLCEFLRTRTTAPGAR
jgi:UDP-N-acetylglucosamine acyltransferase